MERTQRTASNLLICCAVILAALVAFSARAADGGRQFVPLNKPTAATGSIMPQSGRQFIPLTGGRAATQTKMLPLNGGGGERVWKLHDLRDAPRIEKSDEVPDDVKLAMATSRMPYKDKDALPQAGRDREKIAAALAPVLGGGVAEESIETDLDMPEAIAAGVVDGADGLLSASGFVWPVADAHFTISSPYGPRRHPITGKQDFHAGIDIPAPQGTKVLAAADGEVTAVGEHPRLGRFVRIAHADGSYSLYGHLQRWTTKPGTAVRAGDRIGLVGSTGRSTGPHLDFSIRKDGKPFNPMSVLAGALAEKKLAFAE